MDRVAVAVNTDYDPDQPGAAVADTVTVALRSGAVLSGEPVRRARGHADNPLREEDLRAKFEGCLEAGRSDIPAPVLYERLVRLDAGSARALTRLH